MEIATLFARKRQLITSSFFRMPMRSTFLCTCYCFYTCLFHAYIAIILK